MPTTNALAGPDCTDPKHQNNPNCNDIGGGTADLSGLVRVQMADWGGAGISPDNEDSCNPGAGPLYDYWARFDTGLTDGAGCPFHNIRSDASGGGRWFLMLPTQDPPPSSTTRWLTVDFSDPAGSDVCPDFEDDANGNAGTVYTSGEAIEPASGTCVDNLAVWIQAQRALHQSASRTPVKIRLMRIGQSTEGYWNEFAFIEYIDPLYLRAPESIDVGYGTSCQRVISTEPGLDDTGDVREAELREWAGVFNGPLIGTYNLRFEACLTRAE